MCHCGGETERDRAMGATFEGASEWDHHRLQDPLQAKVPRAAVARNERIVGIDGYDGRKPALVHSDGSATRNGVSDSRFGADCQRIRSHHRMDPRRDV